MLLRPAVVVIRRVVVALVLSVFVGVTALAQTTPAWAAQYDVTATITVGTGPRGVAVSPDGTKAYVANGSADTVSVINTTTNAVDATITVGPRRRCGLLAGWNQGLRRQLQRQQRQCYQHHH